MRLNVIDCIEQSSVSRALSLKAALAQCNRQFMADILVDIELDEQAGLFSHSEVPSGT